MQHTVEKKVKFYGSFKVKCPSNVFFLKINDIFKQRLDSDVSFLAFFFSLCLRSFNLIKVFPSTGKYQGQIPSPYRGGPNTLESECLV